MEMKIWNGRENGATDEAKKAVILLRGCVRVK